MTTTLNDIAERLNVSPQTVSRALSGTNKENRPSSIARAEKIRLLAKEMNYRPNAAARSISRRSTRNIGVLVAASHVEPFTANSVYFSILGVNDVLEPDGYITSIVRVEEIRHQLEIRSRAAEEVVFDGVIALGSIPVNLRGPIESLFGNVVWLDTNVDLPQKCLTRNELQVGRMVGEAIVDRGYRKAVWFGRVEHRPTDHHSHEARHTGLQQVLRDSPVSLEVVDTVTNDDVRQIADQLAGHLDDGVAVVASEPHNIQLVTRAAMVAKKHIGEDFGLVACDATPNQLSVWPELTHVKYERYEAGQEAARMMLQIIRNQDGRCFSEQLSLPWSEGATLPRLE